MPFDYLVGWLVICWFAWKFVIRKLFIRAGWFEHDEMVSAAELRRIRDLDTPRGPEDTER